LTSLLAYTYSMSSAKHPEAKQAALNVGFIVFSIILIFVYNIGPFTTVSILLRQKSSPTLGGGTTKVFQWRFPFSLVSNIVSVNLPLYLQ